MTNSEPILKQRVNNGHRPREFALFAGLLLVLIVAPLMIYPIFMTKLLCFALFAMAFNLLVGQTGLLSFGHAMFFGGSAYVAAYALKEWHLPTEVAILLGVVFATFMGLIVGLIAIRRHGIYFAMITLALAQMFFYICVAAPATGGDDGISSVPRRALFSVIDIANDRVLYYFVLVCFFASFLVVYRIMHSPFGQVLRAIRDNEARAVSLGYQVGRYKLLAFVLSASLAGLAGALKVLVFRLATLVDVSWTTSGEVILMALIGGIGTVIGPLLGAAFMLTLQSSLQGLAQWMPVAQGTVFVLAVLVLPRGIAGTFRALRERSRMKASGRTADEGVSPN
ncbi:branched-chain amino acid ABC transporter permease [Ottowia thiooxydans]|uniref:branched-chain amino acid ABC transporter permease n=1 Tax=Ottowia thiooxydans TaxID=219182 RepID=UPI000413F00B|nr:branched-chain amino acid ABC transporter permease [Ottowia thiooxydans]